MATPKLFKKFYMLKCEGNIGEAVEQEVKLCDEVETVCEFTYHGDRVSAGGGCEAAVTAGTRCGWFKFRKCCDLLYDRKFPLRLKRVVYKSYIRPAILYGSEAWCKHYIALQSQNIVVVVEVAVAFHIAKHTFFLHNQRRLNPTHLPQKTTSYTNF